MTFWLARFFIRDVANTAGYTVMLALMLTPRFNRKLQVPIFLALQLAAVEAYGALHTTGMLAEAVFSLLFVVIIILYCVLFHTDSMGRRVLAFVFFAVCMAVSDMLTSFIMSTIFGEKVFDSTQNCNEQLLGYLIVDALFFALAFVSVIIWKRFNKKFVSRSVYIFMLFPLSQFTLLMAYMRYVFVYDVCDDYANNIWLIIGVILSVATDVFAFRGLVQNADRRELKQRLEVMEYQQRAQYDYYENLRRANLEMSKLRHDFSNVIVAAYELSCDPQTHTQGVEMLRTFKEKMDGTKAPYYCQSAVLNTIIWDKAKAAQEGEITFTADIKLPDEPKCDPVDLCCLLANMLDNAIRAAAECGGEKHVSLSSRSEAGRLYFTVRNSTGTLPEAGDAGSLKTTKADKSSHGYGTQIIAAIAERYDGEAVFRGDGGEFVCSVSLVDRVIAVQK